MEYVGGGELNELFSFDPYTKHADEIFERVYH